MGGGGSAPRGVPALGARSARPAGGRGCAAAGEAGELRAELSRYGVVVRDDGKQQHFRLTRAARPPA
ncbi:CysS/YqeB C-terminal domain-containing protein [Verrucosispora sioxanthis]|uniref:CysS/YqeB C-terminal domain-containing protein n=1 Tax=Verrucosispora sioxanthis TaxID=2499994 RepID=UPI004039D67F